MIRVDRCICTDQTFAQLLQTARKQKLSLDQLAQRTGVSACCGMSRPCIARTLATGQTIFHQLLDAPPE